jgi:hypothetical protein
MPKTVVKKSQQLQWQHDPLSLVTKCPIGEWAVKGWPLWKQLLKNFVWATPVPIKTTVAIILLILVILFAGYGLPYYLVDTQFLIYSVSIHWFATESELFKGLHLSVLLISLFAFSFCSPAFDTLLMQLYFSWRHFQVPSNTLLLSSLRRVI